MKMNRSISAILVFQIFTLNTYITYAQWVHIFDPNNGSNIHCIAVTGNNLVAGSSFGVYLSTDKGISWNLSSSQVIINTFYSYGNSLYAGTEGGGIFLSTNNGENWTTKNVGLSYVNCFTMINDILFAGTPSGLFRSTNLGNNWEATNVTDNYVSSLIATDSTICVGFDVWIFPKLSNLRGKNYYTSTGNVSTSLGAYGNGIYFSRDTGTNWTFTGLYDLPNSFLISDNILFAGTSSGRVFRSVDKGINWSSASNGLVGWCVNSLATKGNCLFAGCDSGVFVSINNGTSWTAVNSGLTSIYGKYVLALAVMGDTLFAAVAGSGIWKRPISDMIITKIESESKNNPAHFYLEQNYPNPFNPITTISFTLQIKSFVSLKVYDLAGKEVATLVNEKLSAGKYLRQWNAVDLPSGVYFYRLQAGSFMDTKKLVLIR